MAEDQAAELGRASVSTVVFELDGIVYETELTSVEADRLRATFNEWIAHARRRREPARRSAAMTGHRRAVR
ncbi:Lsr2 dimerization domain-containing protein [Nocardia sp. NPDC003482]